MPDLIEKVKAFFKIQNELNRQFFSSISRFVWGDFGKHLSEWLKIVRNEFTSFFGTVETIQWTTLLNSFVENEMIDREDAKELLKLKDIAHPFDIVMFVSVALRLSTNYLAVQSEANMNLQSQKVNKHRRPNLPYHTDLLNAAFIAPEKTGEVKEVLKRLGMPDDVIDLLFIANYRLYPEETIKTLFLRGILSNDEMFMRMREHGYTDTRIKEIAQGWEVIPGAQDLFWMVGKEAFEPDIIKMIGLDDEFPEDQVQWLQKQGISSEWAHKYWYAHWDQPSVQTGFEMLHRGVIGWDELNVLFKAVEMPPFWRDKLTKIAYTPYTRVDVRRMHDVGVLTDEEVLRSYKDLGYDDDKALQMTKFTILYNRKGDKDLTKGQILSSYSKYMITRNDAKDLLMGLDYKSEQSEYMLYYEDYKRDLAYQEQLIKNIGDKYTLNLIDQFEARKRLNALNLPAERVEILLETWEIDRYQDIKLPSKSDLDKFFRNKIVSVDVYREQMRRLGYTIEAISWYESLIKLKKAG